MRQRMRRGMIALLAAALMFCSTSVCVQAAKTTSEQTKTTKQTGPEKKTGKAESGSRQKKKPPVTISKKKATLLIRQKVRLKLKNAEGKVTWSTDKKSVAAVSKKGIVTAKKSGTAIITAVCDKKRYTCRVTVKKKELYTPKIELVLDHIPQQRIAPAKTSFKFKNFASSDRSVVRVSTKGLLTARSPGKAVVTFECRGHTYKCKVKVRKKDYCDTYDIPRYWKSEISSAVKQFQVNKELVSGHTTSFVYFTDPHWKSNTKHSDNIINYLVPKLSVPAICGGDIVSTYATSRAAALKEMEDFYADFDMPLYTSIGNHDVNRESLPVDQPELLLSEEQLYDGIIAQQETISISDGSIHHSYMDDGEHKVRFVNFFYDKHRIVSDETLEWIDERVKELPEDWTVVLLSHAGFNAVQAGQMLRLPIEGERLMNHFLKLKGESDAKIACWLVGHVHRDFAQNFFDEETGESLLLISTNCDNKNRSVKWGGLTMKKGTTTEQVIDLVQIDLDARKIYMTRIGAGHDRVYSYH